MNEIKQGQVWQYNGPGAGKGMRHIITDLGRNVSDGLVWITTWSYPLNSNDIGGYSWYGPIRVFTQQFSQTY